MGLALELPAKLAKLNAQEVSASHGPCPRELSSSCAPTDLYEVWSQQREVTPTSSHLKQQA